MGKQKAKDPSELETQNSMKPSQSSKNIKKISTQAVTATDHANSSQDSSSAFDQCFHKIYLNCKLDTEEKVDKRDFLKTFHSHGILKDDPRIKDIID